MADKDLEATFEKAAEFAKSCIGNLPPEKILRLYGLFKQATEGDNETAQPRFWNLTAKQKWDGWYSHKGKARESAMAEYISIVEEMNPNWSEERSPTWVVHSVMQNNDKDVVESEKDVFYWVKENDCQSLQHALSSGIDVNCVDADGLGLCHWAADRGHLSAMRLLLTHGANPNLLDADSQTPLHYAASCGHCDVVSSLLQHRADPALKDSDGNKPCDVAGSQEIVQILNAV